MAATSTHLVLCGSTILSSCFLASVSIDPAALFTEKRMVDAKKNGNHTPTRSPARTVGALVSTVASPAVNTDVSTDDDTAKPFPQMQ